ncbi:hypothetical protein KA012_03805 [Candidatus Woesebacteria bacterium]|nr:hypothetical protein [Candidatus Woesebacteria bacterium]
MKLLFRSLSWFFLSAAYVFAIIAGFSMIHGSRSLTDFTRMPLIWNSIESKSTDSAFSDVVLENVPAQNGNSQHTQLETGDARPQLVAAFLERYNSPMTPYDEYGIFFVDLADKYEFDFRLLPAISMQESGLCKSIPTDSFNCLGLGVHERGTWSFTSYRENFEAAAKILKKNYIDIGLTTPEQIMRKYTPSSNGSWASSVNQWMAEMRYNDRSLGRERKTNASVLEFAQSSPDSAATAEATEH